MLAPSVSYHCPRFGEISEFGPEVSRNKCTRVLGGAIFTSTYRQRRSSAVGTSLRLLYESFGRQRNQMSLEASLGSGSCYNDTEILSIDAAASGA